MTVQSFESELSSLLSKLTSQERRKLARDVAKQLRRSNQRRIAAQCNPDGSAFEERKPQKIRSKKGSIRRGMFRKLRTDKYLKAESSPNAAVVSFVSAVERIARVHQDGLRDRVRPGGPEVQYPARQLLGFQALDIEDIRDAVLTHLSA